VTAIALATAGARDRHAADALAEVAAHPYRVLGAYRFLLASWFS
jgi:hypothetical protein